MAAFKDQLSSLTSSESQVAEAMAGADARVRDADAARACAEARWQAAFDELRAAQAEMDGLK